VLDVWVVGIAIGLAPAPRRFVARHDCPHPGIVRAGDVPPLPGRSGQSRIFDRSGSRGHRPADEEHPKNPSAWPKLLVSRV